MKKKMISRRFLGKTEGFKDKQERNFYKTMLKAYLKGKEYFSFGRNSDTLQPIKHKVEQEYYEPKLMGV